MNLKLRNIEVGFEATPPTETRIVRGSAGTGWVLNMTIKTELTSDEVDRYFTEDNMQELTFSAELEDGNEYSYIISGYKKLNSASIKRGADGSCTVDIQLIKEAAESENQSV